MITSPSQETLQEYSLPPNESTSTPFRDSNYAPPAYSPESSSSSVFASSSQAIDPHLSSNQNFVDEKRTPLQLPSPSLQIPQPEPGPGPSNRSPPSSGFRFTSPSATELLNPPPPCFTRAPPHHELMTQPFQPISVISIESQLDKGFPSMAPPSPAQTHPFVVHDVQEEDWTRLLNDVKAAGRISPLNRIMAGVAPAVVGVGIFPVAGILLSIMMRKKMKQRRQGIVSSIIEHWNLYFFHPRHIEITLAQGHVVHAGAPGPPPDMPHLLSPTATTPGGRPTYFHAEDAYPSSDSDSSSSSSSDSDSDDDNSNGKDKKTRRELKKVRKEQKRVRKEQKRQACRDVRTDRQEWKREKRARRVERKRRRMELKAVRRERWRLIVSFRPYTA